MKTLDIAEVAQGSGLPASTLRFYEEKGLIRSTGRHGLRRLFAESVLERLALVVLGQGAGFTLEEMAEMFGADGSGLGDWLAAADSSATSAISEFHCYGSHQIGRAHV